MSQHWSIVSGTVGRMQKEPARAGGYSSREKTAIPVQILIKRHMHREEIKLSKISISFKSVLM